MVNITKHSKVWWNEDCQRNLDNYKQAHSIENWKEFRKTVKKSKHIFFDDKITEIANKKYGPWELMNWVKKCKLLAVEAIQFNRQPCIELEDLWNALHSSFNSAQSCEVDLQLLDKIPDKDTETQTSFAKEELINTIEKCNNSSAPSPNKLTQSHVKRIIKSEECIIRFIDITNACTDLDHWLYHFKTSMTVIIPKPNKISYNTSKSFHPIVLLNTIGKLFEKMIREYLQFHTISNFFIHPCQLSGLKQRSTTDVGVALTHFIQSGWIKNLTTSMLVFDIA